MIGQGKDRRLLAVFEAHHRLGSLLRVISDPEHLPICVLTWQHGVKHEGWDLRDLSDLLRERGWIVPAYVLPKHGPEEILDPSDGAQAPTSGFCRSRRSPRLGSLPS